MFQNVPRLLLFALLLLALPAVAQDATPTPPSPDATPGLANSLQGSAVITETVPFEEALLEQLQLPDGFQVNIFARNLGNARWMTVLPDGTVLLTRREEGDILALIDADGDGVADEPQVNVVASDLPYIHGITHNEGQVYMATDTQVLVAAWPGGANLNPPQPIIADLPTGGQHPNRTLAFGPDGLLYITVGSTCNACDEPDPRNATILRTQPDGSQQEIFARGLRNTIGFGWHPVTNELWGMDHGTDWRGDNNPPEELNRLVFDTNYGWPFCYGQQQPDVFVPAPPPGDLGRAAYCQTTTGPVLEYTAHSAPIGMVFYTADQFPTDYLNDAFVAMRGSWNRNPPSGYEVVRVLFDENGQPEGFETFMSGFLLDELTNFGRITGLAIAADGSLLIAEDTNGIIYRVSYQG